MRRTVYPVLVPLLGLLPACRLPDTSELPGEEVGTYAVEASLTTNECGAGHDAPPTISFLVDLRHLEGTARGYWRLPDGPQIDGVMHREGAFRFESAVQATAIEPNPALDVPGCAVERREIVEGVLEPAQVEGDDAGVASVPEGQLTGMTRVRVTALPGGDCTALLSVYGGPFPELPCRLEYELAGSRVDAP